MRDEVAQDEAERVLLQPLVVCLQWEGGPIPWQEEIFPADQSEGAEPPVTEHHVKSRRGLT